MRKALVSILVSLILILGMSTMVKATTQDELISYLRTQGGSYITEGDIVRIERHFKQYPISSEQADQLKTKIDEAKAVVDNSGKTEIKDLSKADKDKLRGIANEVAAILDLNLVFEGNKCKIYKDGKLIETAYLVNNKILVYTGSEEENRNNVIAVTALAIVVLATGAFVVGKRIRSAQ